MRYIRSLSNRNELVRGKHGVGHTVPGQTICGFGPFGKGHPCRAILTAGISQSVICEGQFNRKDRAATVVLTSELIGAEAQIIQGGQVAQLPRDGA